SLSRHARKRTSPSRSSPRASTAPSRSFQSTNAGSGGSMSLNSERWPGRSGSTRGVSCAGSMQRKLENCRSSHADLGRRVGQLQALAENAQPDSSRCEEVCVAPGKRQVHNRPSVRKEARRGKRCPPNQKRVRQGAEKTGLEYRGAGQEFAW